ncbi:molybdopterin-containing oxidoreductase family protein [Sulfuricystis multivorans]|uniref:molybdopterin-containing oxidoreductase family protein n=1 Tax=Sulfuricystis multivorans TaxID=2211108 RepID=UPI001559A923|nr:molybdopterin-dependent oxidoreductase [Sulfuricystis multivorans]
MGVSRRGFLKTSGALSALATAGAPLPVIAEAAKKFAVPYSPGTEKYVKSQCCHCVNFCGIEVKLQNDVIRAIYPDKARADYYNWGICPKGASGVFNTYNPYRLKKPMKRTNPDKGIGVDPKWVEISWEEAFSTITDKLAKIRADNPSKLIWHHGHGKYLIGDQFPKAFAAAFGTPNVIHRTTTCEAARHVADELTWGYHGILPDLEYTNLYLNFGANAFESEQWARWLDHATIDAKARGMKLIAIEPRLSNTGAKADEWLPIRPAKDVLLLLGMAKVLLDDGTIDKEFLVNYTNAPQLVGADGRFLRDKDGKALVWDSVSDSARPFTEGVKPALLGHYEVNGKPCATSLQLLADEVAKVTPEHVEQVAGVPAARVVSLAREFAREAKIGATIEIDGKRLRYRPVAIYSFRGLAAKEFGVQNWRAALILQMLVGSIDAVGGLHLHGVYRNPAYFEPAKCEYPPQRADLAKSVYFPHSHHDVCQQVALTLLDPKAYGLPYEPEMQIFYATNRPMSTSDAKKQFEGYKKTFNVVIDIVETELAQLADIVLPDLTYLESWHYFPGRWTPSTKHEAIRQPVVNVYGIPHDGYSIIWELAKRLGLRDAYIEQLNKIWGLKEHKFLAGRDYTAKEAVALLWEEKAHKPFDYALEHGFLGKKVGVEDRYLKGVEDKFKGPSKPKMNLYAEQLVAGYEKVKETVAKHGIENIDLDQYRIAMSPLPRAVHAEPTPHRQAHDLPFYLVTHKRMYRNQCGNTAQNPILDALGGSDTNAIVIHPEAAQRLGIRDGDWVIVETRVGRARGRTKFSQGVRPDVVTVSYHYGHFSPGFPAYAKKGTWINQALELHPDKLSGMNSFNDTKCKLIKA